MHYYRKRKFYLLSMTLWDYRLKEIREALERYEIAKRNLDEKTADKELEYAYKHLYSMRNHV